MRGTAVFALLITLYVPLTAQQEISDSLQLAVRLVTNADDQLNGLLHSGIQRQFGTDIRTNLHEIYVLNVHAVQQNSKAIAGIETRIYVPVTFEAAITNALSGAVIHSQSEEISGRGSSHRAALQDAVRRFVSGYLKTEQVSTVLKQDIETYFHKTCTKALAQVAGHGDMDALRVQLNALRYFARTTCSEKALLKEAQLTRALDSLSCSILIQELSIRVHSREYQARQVVSQLLGISPDAPCAAEAIEIAKVIGSHRNLTSSDKEIMHTYIRIHAYQNASERRSGYRRLYYSY